MTIQSLNDITTESGIYYFYENKKLLYIGKAKNLRNRIKAHFTDR
jgi:excinuclease UvrABC nuclease subunit